MYKNFFGLRENPFNANPDPRYLFLTPQTQEALDEMTYGIHTRKGLILLTGEVGTGKTTLINRLLDWLRQQKTPTAFIFNSHLESSDLFDFILSDFGVPFDSISKTNSLMRLNNWLIERYRAGETAVLIVDEAQGLPIHLLEEIRMLLNLETPHAKLLQIVLSGQPELEERLERPDMRQLKQRITLRCKTAALTLNETHEYVRARLRIAGANGKPIFASQTLDAVHFYSRGIPRIVNLLCEHALINAYADNVRPIPPAMIEEIAREFQFEGSSQPEAFEDFGSSLGAKLIPMESAAQSVTVESSVAAAHFLSSQEQLEIAIQGTLSLLSIGNTGQGEAAQAVAAILSAEQRAMYVGEEATASAFAVTAAMPALNSRANEVLDQSDLMASPCADEPEPFPELTVARELLAPSRRLLHVVEAKESSKRSPNSGIRQAGPAAQTVVRSPAGENSAKATFLGARKAARSLPGLWLAHRIMKLRNRLVRAPKSPNWTKINGDLRTHVNQAVRSSQEIYIDCTTWLRKSYFPAASRVQTGARKSVYRWLNAPWPPTSRQLPNSRRIET
jgi:general secretion pathway protein A